MSDTRLDPATMMEEKPSNNIDLTKKIKTPGPGDPPKKSKPEAPNLGEGITVEPSKLNETDADNNIYASAEWSRDKSLKHLESVLGNDKDPWFWDKINPRYVDTRDIGSTRLQMGEAQGSLAKVGDGLVQFGGNAAATFLKEFSYLFDVHNHLSGGKDPGNWFADALTPVQEALNEEFAIYRTSEDDVAFGEIGWIAEGIGQMGTTAGMLGAMLVTRGVGGTAGRLSSALSKARKMEGAASFTNKLKAAYKATGALKNSTWGSDFGYAVLSRAGESAMEADDTYRSIKEELISMGIDPDMAEAKASQAASEVYKGNWLMLGQDILQQRMFSGLLGKGGFFGGKTAEKVAEGATKGGVWSKAGKYLASGYGVGKDMVTEGMEEAYQYWVQEQARNKALVTSGLKSGPQYKAFNEFLTDGQMWNSAIWGAAGSAMMSGGMKAIGYLNKKREEIRANTNMTPSEKADALMEVEEELSKVESRMILPVKIKDYYDAISEASLTGNTETVANLLTRMAVDSAITDVITGKEAEGAILKETFAANPAEALSKLMNGEVSISEEQSKLLQATGESYVAAYNKAQELFNKNKTKYNNTAVAQAFTVAEMDVELTASKSKANQAQITELKSKIAEKLPEEAKVVSSQVEEQFRQKAAERAILQAEMLEITNADDKEALVGIKAAKAKAEADLKDSTKKLEEFEKSEDTSKEDKKALKDNGFDLLGKTTEGEQLLSKMISDYMNLSAQTNAKEFLKNLTEEGVKKIQEKNEKIRKANEKAKSSNAAEDAEGNTVRNPNNATNENIEETLEEDENVEPVDDPNAEDGDEYYDRADQSFNNNELAEETKLSFENGVAWRSNNQGLTSNETQPAYEYKEQEQMPGDLENRKHVTAFLENPNTDFSQYELEYQVDMERLEHTATKNIIPDAQLKAIKEGKEVPAMGMLPIKILIIDKATGKPKSVNGNPLTLFIHNANPVDELVSLLGNSEAAKNLNFPFRSDIMESAIAQTVQEKKEIYENFKAGKPNFRGDLVKKNKGHVIRGEEKSIASLSDEITPDNEMGIGTGVHIKLPNGRTTSIGTKNPKPGVVFVKHNDGWIPVKTRKLTQEEADVVVSIYEAILEVMSKTTNNKPSEVKLSDFPDLKKKINALGNFGFISKEATLIDALNVFVYQGSNTKGNRKLIAFKDSKRKTPLVSMGDNLLFNLEDLRGEKRQAAIDHLMNNKLRNIELQRLGDKAYKSHVMDFLTTKLSTTPEGNLFVQPTFVHERKSKLTKATEKTAQEIYEESLKRDIAEEQERVAAGEGAADLLAEMESKLEEQQVQKETTPVSTDAKADIERRRQEEKVVHTATDKKGRKHTYFSTTTEKDGLTKTKFTFNRSDKDSTQRNTTSVPIDIALGDKYTIPKEIKNTDGSMSDQIPENTIVHSVSEIREADGKAGATVMFQNKDDATIRWKGDIVLEINDAETQPTETQPTEAQKSEIERLEEELNLEKPFKQKNDGSGLVEIETTTKEKDGIKVTKFKTKTANRKGEAREQNDKSYNTIDELFEDLGFEETYEGEEQIFRDLAEEGRIAVIEVREGNGVTAATILVGGGKSEITLTKRQKASDELKALEQQYTTKPESTSEVVKDFKLHIPGVGIFYLDNKGVVRDSNAEVIIDPIINNRINIAKASNEGTLTRDGKYAILPNGTVVDTETYKTAENYKAKEEVTTQEVSDPTFDKELAQKIQDKLQELYPEIKLNITNEPVWQRQSKNIFNQEQYNNEVNFRLKAVEILSSDKAKQIFEKGQNNNWTLNKVLDEIGGFGNRTGYKNLFTEEQLNSNVKNLDREQLALELTSNYSYAVEINTSTKNEIGAKESYNPETGEVDIDIIEPDLDYIEEYDDDGNIIGMKPVLSEKGKKQLEERPTQHYSNLTVPGGTNYTENKIETPAITPSIQGHAAWVKSDGTDNGIGWFRSDDKIITEKSVNKAAMDAFGLEDENESSILKQVGVSKTRRILEVQSDLFQKGRDKEDLFSKEASRKERARIRTFEIDGNTYHISSDNKYFKNNKPVGLEEFVEKLKEYSKNLKRTPNTPENQFLQLLNKDNNWVTFFVKSIIQDSAKKGYEKVLFPLGETIAKIEQYGEAAKIYAQLLAKKQRGEKLTVQEENAAKEYEELNQKSVVDFYEVTVTNILKKQGYNPVEITDEYGNKWNELTINQSRDLSNIMLQKNEANQIIGQANIKAMTVLIDAVNQKQDTLPHEYAHHYIAWNRENPIVQEAIKKWGSEEALVQSIGEQSVKQKGEAWSWWTKFVKWLLGDLNKLSKLEKEQLTKILTDAFLTRQDLSELGKSPAKTETQEEGTVSMEEFNAYLEEAGEALSEHDFADFPDSEASAMPLDFNTEVNNVKKEIKKEVPVKKEAVATPVSSSRNTLSKLDKLKGVDISQTIVPSGENISEDSNKNTNFTPKTDSLKEEGKETKNKCNGEN